MNSSHERDRQKLIDSVAARIDCEAQRYLGETFENYILQRMAYAAIIAIRDEDAAAMHGKSPLSLFANDVDPHGPFGVDSLPST